VLYLAEVQRKTRVIGSGKAELKLLACQRTEQSWSAVPGEEVISAPDDANYNAGMLVMIELSANKQVQRHTEAGRQLVSILQNFSRLQEKSKTQEEEIEQWKQSLTYQSQELNRREMEMEARQEQLQQMEEDFVRLEQQQQELTTTREEVDRQRNEFERKSQELEGAWAHLRGEMSRLEERQAEMTQSAVLDEQQSHYIQELLNRLSGAVAPTESVREQLNLSFDVLGQQQRSLDHYCQDLEQQRSTAQQLQNEVDHQSNDLHHRWQEWHKKQNALDELRPRLEAQKSTLSLKQEQEQSIAKQLQTQNELYQGLKAVTGEVVTDSKLANLESISLEELKSMTQELERELEKSSRFVNSQEEELTLQQQTIDQLKARIQQASDYERLQLETELADEQESYNMLNETLVGQRRNLQERGAILKQHQTILARRQGLATPDAHESEIDLTPVLSNLEALKQQQEADLQALKAQIQELKTAIADTQSAVDHQTAEQDNQRNELKQLEQQLQSQRSAAAELWGKVNTYQAILQPTQDGIAHLREKLDSITQVMAQFQEASDYQLQAIAEMRQVIANLMGNQSPEYIAS
jgi:chromosome segregation ATPase